MSDYVYLDWGASAPVKYFAKDYYIPGNPNSSHILGLEANKALDEARDRIKKCLDVSNGKVLFCRCATEAVGWLCKQFIEYDGYSQSYCSKYEHDSVLENIGDCVTYSRTYDCDEIYLHQYVNQLTGTVFPIESIGKQVQSTGAFFGSDFTASIGHYPLPNNLESFCDAVWFSGHKFGCEPGIGAIWLSDRLFNYLGGSEDNRNEYGLIHGTPNVSSAVAMSYAMEHTVTQTKEKNIKWGIKVRQLGASLQDNSIEHLIIGENQPKTHAINAVYLPNINADALTQYLSNKSIYISPGHSACTSDDSQATRVLEAFGLTKEQASQTVRVSFGEDSTQEDVDALVKGIVEFKELFV